MKPKVANKNSSNNRVKKTKQMKSTSPKKNVGEHYYRTRQWLVQQKIVKGKAKPAEEVLSSDAEEYESIKLELDDDEVCANVVL